MDFLYFLQQHRSSALDTVMSLITQFGGQTVLVVICLMIYWCFDKKFARYMMLTFFISGFIVQALKITFCVPRPWLRDARLVPVGVSVDAATGYSFPSGHTGAASAIFGSLATKVKRPLKIALWALISLVAFSRMYLGVHTPEDVLVSILISVLTLLFSGHLLEATDRSDRVNKLMTIIGIALGAILCIYAALKPYPAGDNGALVIDSFATAGMTIGLFVGLYIERRWVKFKTYAPVSIQILKFTLGMAVVGLIMLVPCPLPSERVVALVRYMLLTLAATCLLPYVFQKLGNRIEKEKQL